MRNRLITKFIMIYVVIGIVGFTLISTLGSRIVQKQVFDAEGRRMYNGASRIADSGILLSLREASDIADLYESLRSLASYQDCDIWLISSEGSILLNTGTEYHPDRPEQLSGFDPVALGRGYYSVGTFFNYYPSDRLSVMVPVTGNLNIRGYVAFHSALDVLYRRREKVLAIIHFLFLILYLISLSAFIPLYVTVLRPLKKITTGTREFAAGHLDYTIPVSSEDELGTMASSLNFMSDEMKKVGDYQRRFIANVSHDFRSPLTSIKGYVEAILDGTIPPEMREKYLRIVLAETERLTTLTNGILTLNSIDQKGSLLDITDFDINEVIRDTAASFEGTCTSRKISIELLLTGEQLFVSADLGKIQQVLYNLIDNAVKFSKDGSTIHIETDIRHGKVFVSVKDHGVGIPSSSLGKIWERFYKTDAARGRERKGNGLGLAIVREIINQHHQNISVVSTVGVGTEFVFSLEPASGATE